MGTTYLESRDRHIAGMVDRERNYYSLALVLRKVRSKGNSVS